AAPFAVAMVLFLLSYVGLVISLWPMVVPYRITLWQAASSTSTQAFLLVGTLFLLPAILMYSGWSYWVFRGKVRRDLGYHEATAVGATLMDNLPQVVIVGGGFGGLAAAQALKRTAVRIILIDRVNHHVFQPLLYQVATSVLTPGQIAFPIRGTL